MGAGCCKEEAIDFNSEIELSHFHLLRSVGKGAFGKVRVVQHKRTKEIYALKYINKAKCIRMRAVENIIQERRLLEEVEFSLICNLRYAFQDDENLFMVLDLMLGGDLRFHLERAGPMREDVVRFYVAELALALDALHARRIIHRDLKPDNVLLDEHGHAHLTDFNIAVYYNPSKPLVSIAGSMAYMAPEVLLRKGYFESVDWWSLGVVMFELLFGKRPFRGKSNDLLTNSILRDPLPFPENVNDLVSAPCLDVLSKLCERDISKRMGCTPEGLDAFKKHPWFHGIDWDKLVTKEALPPFEPDSKRANFDATHELEELLMEDNPLKAKKRAQTSPETELSAEMQMMEDKFIVYDFTKVKRSHSLSRGRTMRPGIDQKMNSGTLDGVVTKSGTNTNNRHGGNGGGSSGRIDAMPLVPQPVAKAFRPDSPSDRVGQDRFNPDEDQVSLTGHHHQQQQRLRNSPLSSPTLHSLRDPSTPYRTGNGRNGSGQQQQKQQQQYHQEKIGDYFQSDALMSENIIVPSSSLPRPLQNTGGNRVTSPRDHSNSITTTPSSPSTSFGHSTLTSLTTPPTSYSSSPAPPKQQGSLQSGTVLFSTPESGTSLSTMATPTASEQQKLLDSVNIPAVAARRAVRGRESLSHPVNSMPAALTSGQRRPTFEANPNQYPQPHYPQYQQQAQQHQMRPMSAYTSTTTLAGQDRPGKYSHRQPSSSSLYGDGGSSSSNGTLYHSNSGSSYKAGLTTVPQQYAMASYGADRNHE
ncbi:serine/threonine kinase 32 [Entomortierella parvispora]|uniref:Serine/threonine kinase 32 n=1 Tax=Entomortierella parvispora TaxID=205924 RepID=A0A9P3LUI7_9FUNG|nr:serine/threonine kinase 32 [Entomortierella parvispora]